MKALINLWIATQNGTGQVLPKHRLGPPPHMREQDWRFICECGYWWTLEKTDPDRREGQWVPPVRQCVSCHAYVTGRPVIVP